MTVTAAGSRQPGHCGAQRGAVPGVHDEPVAVGRQAAGQREAEPPGGAGDDREMRMFVVIPATLGSGAAAAHRATVGAVARRWS